MKRLIHLLAGEAKIGEYNIRTNCGKTVQLPVFQGFLVFVA